MTSGNLWIGALACALIFTSEFGYAQGAARGAQLKADAERKLAAGEVSPKKLADPGFPIMQCLDRQVVPTTIEASAEMAMIMQMTTGTSAVICANSDDGAAILA